MQEDFHYYATYVAAYLAGYSHKESLDICYSAQFVDQCTATLLNKIKAPENAATTQLQLELMDSRTDLPGLINITQIWSSFHFLPYDLYAEKKWVSKRYRNKYRLICGPNGKLVADTVELAKNSSLQAVGIAMHVLADTWAHRYFAGTPSLVINDTNYHFYELIPDGEDFTERQIRFRHSASTPDDIEKGLYTCSLHQTSENSVMNLGHGRAGHFPDYSFARYKYLPAWGEYKEVYKNNPEEYMKAFCQMVYAMRYLRGEIDHFELDTYDTETVAPYEERIRGILNKRQLIASEDWKTLAEDLSGKHMDDFGMEKNQYEYTITPEDRKSQTFFGKFITAAIAHKSMVTGEIQKSGNNLAGFARK